MGVSRSSAEPARGRILIVNDEGHVRLRLARTLAHAGYEVTEAESAPQALERLKRSPYDLLILDMRMPGMDGLEMIVRAHEIQPEALILVLTGAATLESTTTAIQSQAVDYLMKPTSLREVRATVHRALATHAQKPQRQDAIPNKTAGARRNVRGGDGFAADSTSGPAGFTPAPACPELPELMPLVRAGPVTLDLRKRRLIVDEGPMRIGRLTRGEAKVLEFLMRHPNQVLTPQQVVRQVWGNESSEVEASSLLRPYIFRLRQKIEVNPKEPHLIQTVHSCGYVFKIV